MNKCLECSNAMLWGVKRTYFSIARFMSKVSIVPVSTWNTYNMTATLSDCHYQLCKTKLAVCLFIYHHTFLQCDKGKHYKNVLANNDLQYEKGKSYKYILANDLMTIKINFDLVFQASSLPLKTCLSYFCVISCVCATHYSSPAEYPS